MPVSLVGVEIDDHGGPHRRHVFEKVMYGERYVGVSAKAAAFRTRTVMKAAADVDRPAAIERQFRREDRAARLIAQRSEDLALNDEVWEHSDDGNFGDARDVDAPA